MTNKTYNKEFNVTPSQIKYEIYQIRQEKKLVKKIKLLDGDNSPPPPLEVTYNRVMEIEKIRKTKQQQVWEILDRDGIICDSDTAKIFGHERLWCVSEHIRKWKAIRRDQAFFKDKKIIGKRRGYKKHLVRVEGQKDGAYYQVCKEFYQTLNVNQE